MPKRPRKRTRRQVTATGGGEEALKGRTAEELAVVELPEVPGLAAAAEELSPSCHEDGTWGKSFNGVA